MCCFLSDIGDYSTGEHQWPHRCYAPKWGWGQLLLASSVTSLLFLTKRVTLFTNYWQPWFVCENFIVTLGIGAERYWVFFATNRRRDSDLSGYFIIDADLCNVWNRSCWSCRSTHAFRQQSQGKWQLRLHKTESIIIWCWQFQLPFKKWHSKIASFGLGFSYFCLTYGCPFLVMEIPWAGMNAQVGGR